MLLKKLKSKARQIYSFAKALFLIAFGFFLAKAFAFPGFKMDENINMVDVLSILVTLFVAWWISVIIDKQKQDKRTEKDIILRRVEQIFTIIEMFHEKVRTGNVNIHDVTSTSKRINVSITSVNNLLSQNGNQADAILHSYIRQAISNISILMTDTTYDNASGVEIVIANSIISVSDNRLNQIELEFENLKNRVTNFEFQINAS